MERVHAKADLEHQRQQERNRADGGAKQRAAVQGDAKRWHLHRIEPDHRPGCPLKVTQRQT